METCMRLKKESLSVLDATPKKINVETIFSLKNMSRITMLKIQLP